MKRKNVRGYAVMLAALLTVLSGCSQTENVQPEATADYSVDISMPFDTVTQAPAQDENNPELSIDANGNVTVYDSSNLLTDENAVESEDQSGYVSLQVGSSGQDVMRMQMRLKELGYFEGNVTGIFDTDTETAVRRFEKSYGAMQTGIATAAFQAKLYADSAIAYGSDEYEAAVSSYYNTLQSGSVGSDVYALQYRLRELGYPITELTAVYDEQTEQCVRLFGNEVGSQNMGVAYIAVLKQIYAEDAPRYSGSESASVDADEDSILTMGDSGTTVQQIQTRLIALGYMEGPATGIYDAATVVAVRQFQKLCGFTVTGSLPYYLQTMLLSDSSDDYAISNMSMDLTIGDEGTLVSMLQERLIQLGYANGTASGVFDQNTADALKLFQKYNSLEETGVATEDVQNALYSDNVVSYKQALRVLAGDAVGVTASPTPSPAPTPEPTETPVPTATPEPEETPDNGTPEPTAIPAADVPLATLFVEEGMTDIGTTPEPAGGVPVEQETVVLSATEDPDATEDPNAAEETEEGEEPTETLAPVSDKVYSAGMKGSEVKAIQSRLKELGYTVKRNSKYDDATVAAVKAFQSNIGVTQSGEVNGTLYAYMFSNAAPSTEYVMYRSVQDYHTLQAGDSGESVLRLQKQLGHLGYMLTADIENANSTYDDATVAAVVSAQNAMGYQEPDGVAGAEFQCFIFSEFSGKIKQ